MLLRDKLNHILGTYVAIGINDPKKYPSAPLLDDESTNQKGFSFTSDESLDAYICSLANNVKG